MRLAACLFLASLALAGCAGKPTTYLALAPAGQAQARQVAVPALSVSAIDIPPEIDRLHLTSGSAPGALHVAGDAEWAGPLGPMARIVLAQDLAARLPGCTVLMPGDALPPGGAASVHVSIQTFMPDAGGTVALQADWSVSAAGGGLLARGRFARRVAGGKRPEAAARGMSLALGELADAIAAGLART